MVTGPVRHPVAPAETLGDLAGQTRRGEHVGEPQPEPAHPVPHPEELSRVLHVHEDEGRIVLSVSRFEYARHLESTVSRHHSGGRGGRLRGDRGDPASELETESGREGRTDEDPERARLELVQPTGDHVLRDVRDEALLVRFDAPDEDPAHRSARGQHGLSLDVRRRGEHRRVVQRPVRGVLPVLQGTTEPRDGGMGSHT